MPDEGSYAFEIDGVEEKKSKAENLMFAVKLRILSGPFAGETVRDWFMLSGKAAWTGKKKMQAFLGRDIEDGEEISAMDLQGAKAIGWVKHDTYMNRDDEQKTTTKIDGFAGPFSCGYRNVTDQELSDGAAPAPNVQQGKEPEGKTYDFEDIPF